MEQDYAFFFFKQTTAYEMRISDWSSDVCSSDLGGRRPPRRGAGRRSPRRFGRASSAGGRRPAGRGPSCRGAAGSRRSGGRPSRSEEHTSELQSLMRISYAVFCLKKKKQYDIHNEEMSIVSRDISATSTNK